MVLNEKIIKDVIRESIETYLFEEQLKNEIKALVRESLDRYGDFSQFESSEEPKNDNNEDERLSDMNTETEDDASCHPASFRLLRRCGFP